jgi:hypothetical protein
MTSKRRTDPHKATMIPLEHDLSRKTLNQKTQTHLAQPEDMRRPKNQISLAQIIAITI